MNNLLRSFLLSLLTAPAFAQDLSAWEFRRTDENIWRTATVPGTVHTDLLRHHLISDPFKAANEKDVQWVDKKDWEYRAKLNITPETLQHDVVEIDFEGLDTYADVYINNTLVLQSQNMFVRKAASIKKYLKSGQNELRVWLHSPIAHDMPRFLQDQLLYPAGNDASDIPLSIHARKAPYHYGWDWGPRLVTSGIWRPVSIKAWNKVKIADNWIRQQQLTDSLATLEAVVTLDVDRSGTYNVLVKSSTGEFETVLVRKSFNNGAQHINIPFTIRQPQRWWPNGLGQQKIYPVEISILNGSDTLYKNTVRIGLRTIAVINEKDKDGASFFVKVNGRPVFMKGANYIPQDNFLPRVTPERYRQLFDDMASSNFNMVRVWGGGIYENDQFYDLADEKGILVWQDFMFACSFYPSDKAFLQQVKEEAEDNITRLRNHPSLALWCGNNEIAVAIKNWGWQSAYSNQQWAQLEKGYDTLFNKLLPETVKSFDPGRFYFPSSPISNWGRKEDFHHGDNHYWGVWHGMEWFESFATHVPRFMSEYGFQSFPDLATVQTYADPSQWNIASPVMQAHQKSTNRGNAAIKTYMDHYYKAPKDFPLFLYLSQLLQAEGIRQGIEAHRRAMPFCMGTLYWQLNDCWPGASWSSIDYYGHWKALQYFVKKAYSPLLISQVPEEGRVQTWLVNDRLKDENAVMEMKLIDMNGKELWKATEVVRANANASQLVHSIRKSEVLNGVDSTQVLLITSLVQDRIVTAQNVFYFAPPKLLQLPKAVITTNVDMQENNTVIRFHAEQLAKGVYLSLEGDSEARFSDNYFDILPGKSVTISVKTKLHKNEVQEQLRIMHLANACKE